MLPVDCIITAAGLSSRMGQWKMMLPWREGTVLDASIKNARCCRRIILVTGFRGEELRARYAGDEGIVIIHNPDYRRGLFSSLQAAAGAVISDYCFITHGDIPCLREEIFHKLWALRRDGAILPHYRDAPGHPVLLSTSALRQAAARRECASMRAALLAGKHYRVALDDAEIVCDIDTPDDFLRAREKAEK